MFQFIVGFILGVYVGKHPKTFSLLITRFQDFLQTDEKEQKTDVIPPNWWLPFKFKQDIKKENN